MITFLCNGEKWRHIGAIRKLALKHGFRYYITDSVSDVGKVLAQLEDKKVEIICVLGGDGTLCQLLTPICLNRENVGKDARPMPAIAILGGGTMNEVFHELQMRGSPREVAQRVISGAKTENLKIKKYPLLRIEHCGVVTFGSLFAFGPIVLLLKRYTDGGRNVLQAFSTFVNSASAAILGRPKSFKSLMDSVPVEIVVNSLKMEMDNVSGFLAGTIPRIVFGLRPFLGETPEELIDTKKFYTVFTSLKPFQIVAGLPYFSRVSAWNKTLPLVGQVIEELFLPAKVYYNLPVKSLRIKVSQGFYTVDGEIFIVEPWKPIVITQGPVVSFVCPE